MEIKVPKVKAIKFNEEYLQNGTPIKWRQPEVHDHHFLALIRDYGPSFLQVYNGHVFNTFDVTDVHKEAVEIIPLRGMNDGGKLIVETIVFDVARIPEGSIFVDSEGTSFMINEVDPYYLGLIGSDGSDYDVQAGLFFTLDAEEAEECRIILPPLHVEDLKRAATQYRGGTP